jgi:hypothetical protein
MDTLVYCGMRLLYLSAIVMVNEIFLNPNSAA